MGIIDAIAILFCLAMVGTGILVIWYPKLLSYVVGIGLIILGIYWLVGVASNL